MTPSHVPHAAGVVCVASVNITLSKRLLSENIMDCSHFAGVAVTVDAREDQVSEEVKGDKCNQQPVSLRPGQ